MLFALRRYQVPLRKAPGVSMPSPFQSPAIATNGRRRLWVLWYMPATQSVRCGP